MRCAPQLVHPSVLLGDRRQGERAFYQTRVDREAVVKSGQEHSGCARGEAFYSAEEKLPGLAFWAIRSWQVQGPVVMEGPLLQDRPFGEEKLRSYWEVHNSLLHWAPNS